jgi:uncharacterized protein (TIGR00369 family)
MDPDKEKRSREAFDRHGFMRLLGARVTGLDTGFCEIRVEHSPQLTQHDGFFHAGVSAAIADSACGGAAFTLVDVRSGLLSVEYKINLLAPARGRELVARARVVRSGRTLKVCAADVYSVEGDEEVLCATTLSTIMELPARDEPASPPRG